MSKYTSGSNLARTTPSLKKTGAFRVASADGTSYEVFELTDMLSQDDRKEIAGLKSFVTSDGKPVYFVKPHTFRVVENGPASGVIVRTV